MCCIGKTLSSGLCISLLAVVGLVGVVGSGAWSIGAQPAEKPAAPAKPKGEQPAKHDQPAKDKAKPQDAGGGLPGGADDMAKWMEMNKPGEMHRKLDFMAGKWDVAMKFVMMPGQPATETKGKEDTAWDLDGRFLSSTYEGEMAPGMKFTGKALMGYNNLAKRYESTWADSSSNGIMFQTGSMDDATHTLTMIGDGDDMMTGKRKSYRSTYTMINKDKYVFKMYDTDANGKEFVGIEGTYTRSK